MPFIEGTPGDDVLQGTAGHDFLSGGLGDDELAGLAGNDRLEGGPGADTLDGGDHDAFSGGNRATQRDNIWGDTARYKASDAGVTVNLATGEASGGHAEGDTLTGIESVRGSDFADTLIARDDEGSTLWGDKGDDVLHGGTGRDYLWGGKGDDTLMGGVGVDYLEGGVGADVLDGGQEAESSGFEYDFAMYELSDAGVTVNLATAEASGGHAEGDALTGIENVIGSQHADMLTARDDDPNTPSPRGSFLYGGNGDDTLHGGTGEDGLQGGEGSDVLRGGEGRDTAYYSLSNAGVTVDLATGAVAGGYAEGDTLTGIENVGGSQHADMLTARDNDPDAPTAVGSFLYGREGDDTLQGGTGDDGLSGEAGSDALHGGEGRDTALYAFSDAGVTVDLATGAGQGGSAEGDTLTGIENLMGSRHADHLIGSDGNNHLRGLGGDDRLSGGLGADTLSGGLGADTFAFGDGDTIADFGAGGDAIDISAFDDISGTNFESRVTIRQSGNDVEVQIGDAVLTLEGVNAADITVDDFLLY